MSLFLGSREKRSWSGEPIVPPYPGVNMYGQTSIGTDPDSALTVPTVWACVNLLANAVSMMPLEVFQLAPDGVPQKKSTPGLLTNPTGDLTQSEWLHMLMVSLLLRGNAIGRVIARDTYLRPTQIDLLDPDRVTITVDRTTGKVTYRLTDGLDITADAWHVRGMTLPGSRVGLSPISYAAATLGVDLSSRAFAQDFFANGGIPKAVVSTDQAVNQEQSRTIKERLMAATRHREPIVLGQGLTYKTISVNPEESQFLLTQQANVAQIARYFGIPPEMVGGSGGNSLTYANVEQRQLDFLTLGVSFWLKRIEDAVFGLLPAPQYARFNAAALLRTDARTQAEVDNMQLAGKTRVPSELRQRDGLPPMTDAQKAEADMVPLTVTPMGGAKALPALKEPPGPTAVVPAADQQNSLAEAVLIMAQSHHRGTGELAAAIAGLEPPRVDVRGGDVHNHVAPAAPAVVRQDINVAPAEVRVDQPITVMPAAPAEVRVDQPITVQPADVRNVFIPPGSRTRRMERNSDGDIIAIHED